MISCWANVLRDPEILSTILEFQSEACDIFSMRCNSYLTNMIDSKISKSLQNCLLHEKYKNFDPYTNESSVLFWEEFVKKDVVKFTKIPNVVNLYLLFRKKENFNSCEFSNLAKLLYKILNFLVLCIKKEEGCTEKVFYFSSKNYQQHCTIGLVRKFNLENSDHKILLFRFFRCFDSFALEFEKNRFYYTHEIIRKLKLSEIKWCKIKKKDLFEENNLPKLLEDDKIKEIKKRFTVKKYKTFIYFFDCCVLELMEYDQLKKFTKEIEKLKHNLSVSNEFVETYCQKIEFLEEKLENIHLIQESVDGVESSTETRGRKKRRWNPKYQNTLKILNSDTTKVRLCKLRKQRIKIREVLDEVILGLSEWRKENSELVVEITAHFPEINKKLMGNVSLNKGNSRKSVFQNNVMHFQVNTPEEALILMMNQKGSSSGFRETLKAFPKISKEKFQNFLKGCCKTLEKQCYFIGNEDCFIGIIRNYFCAVSEYLSNLSVALDVFRIVREFCESASEFQTEIDRDVEDFACSMSEMYESKIQIDGKKKNMKGFDVDVPFFVFSDAFEKSDHRNVGFNKPLLELGRIFSKNPKVREGLLMLRFMKKELPFFESRKYLLNIRELENQFKENPVIVVFNGTTENANLSLDEFFVKFTFDVYRVPDLKEMKDNLLLETSNFHPNLSISNQKRHIGIYTSPIGDPDCSFFPKGQTFTLTYQLFNWKYTGEFIDLGIKERIPHEMDIFESDKYLFCGLHFMFIFYHPVLLIFLKYIVGPIFSFSNRKNWKMEYQDFVERLMKCNAIKKGCVKICDGEFKFVESLNGKMDEGQKSDTYVNKFIKIFSNENSSFCKEILNRIELICVEKYKEDLNVAFKYFSSRMKLYFELKQLSFRLEFFKFKDMERATICLDKLSHYILSINKETDGRTNHYWHVIFKLFVPQMIKFLRLVDRRTDQSERVNSDSKTLLDRHWCFTTGNWTKITLDCFSENVSKQLNSTMLNVFHIFFVFLKSLMDQKANFKNIKRKIMKNVNIHTGEKENVMEIERPPVVDMNYWKPRNFTKIFPEEEENNIINSIFKDRETGEEIIKKLTSEIFLIHTQKVKGGKKILLKEKSTLMDQKNKEDVNIENDVKDFSQLVNLSLLQIAGINHILNCYNNDRIGSFLCTSCSSGKGTVADIVIKIFENNNLEKKFILTGPGNPVQEILRESELNISRFETCSLSFFSINELDKWKNCRSGVLYVSHSSLAKISLSDIKSWSFDFILVNDEAHRNCNKNTEKNCILQELCKKSVFKIYMSYTIHPGERETFVTLCNNFGLNLKSSDSVETIQKSVLPLMLTGDYITGCETNSCVVVYELKNEEKVFYNTYRDFFAISKSCSKEDKVIYKNTIDTSVPCLPPGKYSRVVDESVIFPDRFFSKSRYRNMKEFSKIVWRPMKIRSMFCVNFFINSLEFALKKNLKFVYFINSLELQDDYKDVIIPYCERNKGDLFKNIKKKFIYLTGKDSSEKRQKMIDEVQFGNAFSFIIGTDVIADGVNMYKMHGSIHIDISKNPTACIQGGWRLNRRGQKLLIVDDIRILAKSTHEEHAARRWIFRPIHTMKKDLIVGFQETEKKFVSSYEEDKTEYFFSKSDLLRYCLNPVRNFHKFYIGDLSNFTKL